MDERLEEIRARADAATDGPWRSCTVKESEQDPWWPLAWSVGGGSDGESYGVLTDGARGSDMVWAEDDARFIAQARSDVPYLLDQLTHSQGRIAELEAALTYYAERQHYDYYGTLEDSGEVARAALEQQPTTLTKEGGGGE